MNQVLKILHVVASMDPAKGGVSQAVRNIIFNNEFANHEVLSLDSEDLTYSDLDQFIVHNVGIGVTQYKFHQGLVPQMRKLFVCFDLVVVHGIWQYHHFASFLTVRALKKGRKRVPKLAVMPHGMMDPYFQNEPSRKFKALRNNLMWWFVERKAINYADAVLFTCEQELLLARETFSTYKPKNEICVGLGVEKPPTLREEMKKAFNKKLPGVERYWLFLSRIHPKKGIDLLIRAYIKLQEELTGELPDLVIAGPLDTLHAKEIKDLASKSQKVHIIGALYGDAKWGAFYGAEFFVLPSHQENFGIAVVEALACGLPVLMTKKINIWKEIYQRNACLIIDEISIDSLVNILREVSHLDINKKKDLSGNGKDIFNSLFEVESCSKRFVNEARDKLNL